MHKKHFEPNLMDDDTKKYEDAVPAEEELEDGPVAKLAAADKEDMDELAAAEAGYLENMKEMEIREDGAIED